MDVKPGYQLNQTVILKIEPTDDTYINIIIKDQSHSLYKPIIDL